jgi:enamine deaminase RidA (YjgF/YER057c/UK114 family)
LSRLDDIMPEGWPRGAGYSHGLAGRGRLVFVAGQVGWDPLTQRVTASDFPAQVDQALANIVAVLQAAGARPQDTARMTWYITDRAAYVESLRETGAAWRRHFGRHFPAMSVVVVSGLLEHGAMLEIEATAVIPDDTDSP